MTKENEVEVRSGIKCPNGIKILSKSSVVTVGQTMLGCLHCKHYKGVYNSFSGPHGKESIKCGFNAKLNTRPANSVDVSGAAEQVAEKIYRTLMDVLIITMGIVIVIESLME
jgi:hypothetical protein